MNVSVQKYGARFFAVYVDGELLAVTVYRKGAETVAAWLRERCDLPETQNGGSYASGC